VSDDRGVQVVYVPSSTISQSLFDIGETLGEIRLLIENTTAELSDRTDNRAVRSLSMDLG
jgi:hypothetical protein